MKSLSQQSLDPRYDKLGRAVEVGADILFFVGAIGLLAQVVFGNSNVILTVVFGAAVLQGSEAVREFVRGVMSR